jgi:hypothetical protein
MDTAEASGLVEVDKDDADLRELDVDIGFLDEVVEVPNVEDAVGVVLLDEVVSDDEVASDEGAADKEITVDEDVGVREGDVNVDVVEDTLGTEHAAFCRGRNFQGR